MKKAGIVEYLKARPFKRDSYGNYVIYSRSVTKYRVHFTDTTARLEHWRPSLKDWNCLSWAYLTNMRIDGEKLVFNGRYCRIDPIEGFKHGRVA